MVAFRTSGYFSVRTWKPVSRYVFFPTEFTDLYNQADGNYSYVVDKNNFCLLYTSHSEHNCKLYAIDTNNHFMESTDALVWDTNGEVPANFPKKDVYKRQE